jgi:hypothetical protein
MRFRLGWSVWRAAAYGWRAWLPFVEDAAAFLAEGAAVVCELSLEGQLFAGVAAGVVYPLAPDGECAQGLQVAVVVPPALLERRGPRGSGRAGRRLWPT